MTGQPWWTSKAFWTALITLAFAALVKFGVIPATEDTALWTFMVLGVLSAVFRWSADQPLTGGSGENIPKGSTIKRLTRD